jgi:hypothetical protein
MFLIKITDDDHVSMALLGLRVKALFHLSPCFTHGLFTEWLAIAGQHLYDKVAKGAKKNCTTEVHLSSI